MLALVAPATKWRVQEVQQSLHFIETETCFGGRRRCVSMRH